jgi:hypothetical protein
MDDFQYYRTGFTYLNDEIALNGMYDFSIKLPPVPARTYEIRMSTWLLDHTTGDIVQIYLDDKICGLPIDMRLRSSDPTVGWVEDDSTHDNGVELDKQMRNRGWMKGPDSFLVINTSFTPARECSKSVGRIITTRYLHEGEHWLRIRKITNNAYEAQKNSGGYDYIELVPLHIVSDPMKPEDRH